MSKIAVSKQNYTNKKRILCITYNVGELALQGVQLELTYG